MMKLLRALAICSVLQLAAWPALAGAELKVDGATEASTSASLHAMYGQHGHRETCLLQGAVIQITVGENDKREARGGSAEAPAVQIGSLIDEMTYEHIIRFSKGYPAKVTTLCRD